MVAKKAAPTLQELFGIAEEALDSSIRHPNRLGYVPYPEQERFHRCELPGRYLAGGNRGGKSDAEVMEAVWWATDTHPFRKRPPEWGKVPLEIRFVVVDVSKGVEQIILPKLKRWLAKGDLIDNSWDRSWNSKDMILTLANGATIDFVTWGMDLMKLGGVPRHIIFFDEEPPQHIFNECTVRLLDYRGWWVIAATPTKGMGWTYDLLWEPALANPETALVGTFELSAAKNPYLKAAAEDMDFYTIGMDKEERDIRESGSFVARSGLVFPNIAQQSEKFIVAHHVPPKHHMWYMSVDVGWNNPTAVLWHSVAPNGEIYTFAEHYQSGMTIAQHAAIIHQREQAFGKVPELRTGDPAMKQTSQQTGVSTLSAFAANGIYLSVDGVPRDVMTGIEKMQSYFQIRPNGKPTWTISSNCVNLIRELKKLRWATYSSDKTAYAMNKQEVIHKKDDHASDSARYFATLMPDLRPDQLMVGSEPVTLSYQDMLVKLSEEQAHPVTDTGDGASWTIDESFEELAGGYY